MLPAAWQRISSKAANYSNAFNNSSSILGSRKSSLSSLSLASFASSDTSFTAVSYTSHHYHTASNTSRISINGDSSVIGTKNPQQQQQVLPDSASEVMDDDYDDLDDAGSCGGDGRIYGKLDCVIEENL